MRLEGVHFRYGVLVFEHMRFLQGFLAEVQEKYPNFFAELGKCCDEFVEHCGLWKNDVRGRREAAHFFLSYACGKLAALYAANGRKIPQATIGMFKALKDGCDSIEQIQSRFDRFCMINCDWAEYFIDFANEENFCWHGMGTVYAWAEAFLEAQKLDEKREADSADITQRTADLLDEWLPAVIDLSEEGDKNIGEV